MIKTVMQGDKPLFKMHVETEIEEFRYSSFWVKESETIAWIQSFPDGCLFIDVGANIGIYSLFCAAAHPEARILSIEPGEANYKRLKENIKLNVYKGRIRTRAGGLSDFDGSARFSEDSIVSGGTGGQVNVQDGNVCLVWTLDYFIAFTRANTFVKIDVDGQERKIIEGGKFFLRDPSVKGVLIELVPDTEDATYIRAVMSSKGFTVDNEFNHMDNHSRYRRAREGINVENVVFTRG